MRGREGREGLGEPQILGMDADDVGGRERLLVPWSVGWRVGVERRMLGKVGQGDGAPGGRFGRA